MLGDAVEQFAPTARFAPVEADFELVQVVLEMLGPVGSLVRSRQPSRQQREDTMDRWKKVRGQRP